jgi:hypothetical protein
MANSQPLWQVNRVKFLKSLLANKLFRKDLEFLAKETNFESLTTGERLMAILMLLRNYSAPSGLENYFLQWLEKGDIDLRHIRSPIRFVVKKETEINATDSINHKLDSEPIKYSIEFEGDTTQAELKNFISRCWPKKLDYLGNYATAPYKQIKYTTRDFKIWSLYLKGIKPVDITAILRDIGYDVEESNVRSRLSELKNSRAFQSFDELHKKFESDKKRKRMDKKDK